MRSLYLLTLIMISSFAKSQNLQCKDFKIGTFKIECLKYNLPSATVNRSEKIQKESTVDHKNEMEGTILWKSECSYELIYTNAPPEMIGKKISVVIDKIEAHKAFCRSTFEGMPDFVLEFEMEKLN